MRLVVAALLASTVVAHAGDDDVDVSGRDAAELRGDALVWEDATFFLEPWDGGHSVKLSSFGRARSSSGSRDDVGRALPVKILSSSMRDFVEVELVQGESCTHRRGTADERVDGLRFFVKRADLAPVLVKPFAITFGDGTSARLAAGVPVMPTTSGAYVVGARGDVLRLPIPHASVGFIYSRGKVEEPARPKGVLWRLDRTQSVKLGDGDFEARHGWLATKPAKHGDTVNVKWATRCIELVVGVPAKSLRKATGPEGAFTKLFPRTTSRTQHTIPRGTPLSTPSGREVAIAVEVIESLPPAGDKACFDARLEMWRLDDFPHSLMLRTFRLCAPSNVVEGPAVTPSKDPLAAPADVAAPPRDAQRTAKGVWWKRLEKGKLRRKPNADDTVVVHYTGWTTDGNMFDSSVKRGEPARFPLRSLIPGWTDGLQVMSIGDKVRFWIPEELAYQGNEGRPKGMLVFDVELLGID